MNAGNTFDASRIRALIFDLDGTLADTIGAIRDAINDTMQKYGYPEKTYAQVRDAIGNGARMLVRRCMPTGEAEDEKKVDRVLASYDLAYARTYLHTRACYEGVREAVAELSARGYRIAVLSNKQDAYVKGLVSQLFGDGEIELAVGQTALPIKPNPTVPRLLAHQLCVGLHECALIGDSDVDVLTAKNAAMVSVGCSWGYRGRSELERAGADAVIDRPDQLLELFLSVPPPVEEFLDS